MTFVFSWFYHELYRIIQQYEYIKLMIMECFYIWTNFKYTKEGMLHFNHTNGFNE